MPRFTRRHFVFLCITVVALTALFKCATRFADAQSSVTAESIQRWRVSNGFYTLTVFGDGTLLAAGNNFASGAGTGVKLNPHDGTTIGDYPVPDVRTSVRLDTGDQDYVVGGYGDRVAVREDGSFVRYLIGLGCCNIPRYPLALDPTNDHAYAQANGELFGVNMTTGAQTNHFYGAIDTFGIISIADSNTLYTAGQGGDAIRLDPVNGHQWHVQIDSARLQPGAVAADGSFIVTSGPAHLENSPQPGRLARVAPDGTIAWNNAVNAVTPPVIGSNNLVFIGTQAAPVDENGAGAIEAYDLATGALVWHTDVQGLPNDLLVGDDGAVYAGTGSFASGRLYALAQTDGAIRQTVTDVHGAWEIVLRGGLIFATGDAITALPVAATNYDPNSPWPVRFHDNQRSGNRQFPLLTAPRDAGPTPTPTATPTATPTPPVAFVVNSTGDGADSNTADGICDDGTSHCTLRAAIQQTNSSPGANLVTFNLPGAGVQTIAPSSALPPITDPLTIDATTQPGYSGAPLIELSGASAGGAHGLYITAGNSRVRGLVINRFSGDGIVLQGGTGNVVEACYLGTDATGSAVAGNGSEGIYVDGSTNAVIGGTTVSARNVVAGNYRIGVYLLNGSTGAQVRNNYIGTNATGTAGVANRVHGILLENSGGAAVTGNVIANNGADGIVLLNSGATTFMANLIGLSADGATALGNSTDGIFAQNSPDLTIGSGQPSDRNVIANSGRIAVYLSAGSNGAKVQGNRIGTDASGTRMMINTVHGVYLENSGTGVIRGNLIANSGADGVALVNAADSVIQSNLIGTDAAGTSAMGNSTEGIYVQNSPNVVIGSPHPNDRNLVANSGRHGIYVLGGSTGVKVEGNRIGTDANGTVAMPTAVHGVIIENSAAASVSYNQIANSGAVGLVLVGAPDSSAYGNTIGTDATGTVAMGSGGDGIYVQNSTNVTIGTPHPNDRNLVANNGHFGVYVLGGSTGIKVQGNRIGTDVSGTARMPSAVHGVVIENTGGALVTDNLIANSGAVGLVLVGASDAVAYSNLIGLSSDGTTAMGNGGDGIYVQNSPRASIGLPNNRNIVANSGHHGIYVLGGSTGAKLQGNFVGTDASGLVSRASAVHGILVENTDAVSVLGNVVGNSGEVGLLLAGASHAVVQGNLLGVGSDGTTPMSNTLDGIFAYNSPHSLIGGAGAGNVIAANHRYGILVQGNTTDLRVQGNSIGMDASGAADLGNTQAGIFIDQSSSNNTIGGTDAGTGNRIAHNGGDGVNVSDGIGNAILGNSIFANAGLGIDLGPDGVTANDAGDADGGANHLQNFPVITSASSAGGTTNAQGTLDSAPNMQYRIELFANTALDPSGHGEGQTYLTATDVMTDANGRASFNVNISATAGTLISATATDAENNTSEFSNADAEAPTLSLPANIFADATGPLGAAVNFTATATDNSGQPVSVACLPESGQTFPHGTTTVRCSASDASGNTATGSFLITVGGNAAPVVPSNYAYVTTNSRPTQLAGLPAGRIDTSDAPVTDLPVNGNPGAMVVAPDGARAYVVSHATNTVSVIETTTNEVVATFNTPTQPSGLAISPDNKRLYLITQSDNSLRTIDVATYQTIATYATGNGPTSVAVAPDGSRIYVSNFNSNNITIINATDGMTSSIENVPHPISIGVLPDHPRLYVVSHLCCVQVIDTTTNQIVKSIGIADVPGALTISPDGKFVYIAHPLPGGPVTVIDTAQEAWVSSYPVCCYPGNGVGNYAGTRVYGTSSGGNGGFIHSFDRDTHVELGRVRLGAGVDGAGPFSIALTPDSTTIDFEHTPGADGLLGTSDDIPLAGGTSIAEQFAPLNVHFALAGGGTPNIATVDGSFVAYHGPGGRANYPARSGNNTLGAAENSNRALELNFDQPIVAALLHVMDYDAQAGDQLDLIAYDTAGHELSRSRLDATNQTDGDGTIRRLSVSARNIRRVVVDFAHAGDASLAIDDLSFVRQLTPDNSQPQPPFQIKIDPGAYAGVYHFNHSPTASTGLTTLSLMPGTYNVLISEYDTPGTNFGFTVDDAGQVTNITKPAVAHAVGNTLVFNNSTITLNPQGYTGHYQLYTEHTLYTGVHSFVLVPGLLYAGDNGYSTPGGSFAFEVNDAGAAVNMNKPGVGTGVGHTVTFNNAPVQINPQAYTGLYRMLGSFDGSFTGAQQFTLIPGLYYLVDDNYGVPQGSFNFKVDDCGRVTDVGRPGAAEGIGNMLRFKNATITINPQAYAGVYRLPSFNANFTGPQQFVLIPALGYYFDNGTGKAGSYFNFRVDSCGHIADIAPPSVTAPAVADGATLILNNTTVQIQPGAYTGTYNAGGYANLSSAASVALVSGLKTFLTAGGQYAYFTPEMDQVNPPSVTLNLGSQAANFALSATTYAPAQGTPYQACALDDAPHVDGSCGGPNPTPFQINIEPGNYAGDYAVNQVDVENPTHHGPSTLSLSPGAYFFDTYYHGGRFSFAVSATGQVTNISNPIAAHANGDTLVLNNTNVTVEPRNFAGLYSLVGQTANFTGAHTFTVIPGLTFRYINYYLGDGFNFDVDAQGAVQNIEKPAAAYANGSTLVLNNTDIHVEPQQYPGSYAIYGHNYVNGARTFTLIPGLTFRYINYYLGDGFLFDVGADGQVHNVTNPAAAQADGATLLLRNTCLRINPGGYTGSYFISSEPFGSYGQSLHVPVPGLSYELVAGSGERAPFALDAAGLATPSALPLNIAGQSYTFALNGGACDQTPPVTTAQLSTPPNSAGWHKSEVTLMLSAADENGGTGVKEIVYSATGAQVVAQTTASGATAALNITTEGATTVAYFARDNAGNAELAHTLTIKLDKTAPTVTITRPANNSAYALGQVVAASYSCTDGGAGVMACTGPVANGSNIDTTSVGPKTFNVTATDGAGNTAAQSATYTVGYAINPLYDQTKVYKSGSTVPIKLQLIDAGGVNRSAPGVVVHAVAVYQISTGANGMLDDAGNANPDLNFRYDGGLYVFNLKTTGFDTGTYALSFTVSGDPLIHTMQFQVRQ
ncbi:MAG: right-handed parallel beta-helix repeat-containing protein [Pyrinomonadaceae bacterium]